MTLSLPRAKTVLGSKQCSRCKEILPLSSFAPGKGKGNTFSYCRECNNEYIRQYAKQKREKKIEDLLPSSFYTITDYCKQLIEGEIQVFREKVKVRFEYEIVCFKEDQAVILTDEINKRFKKYDWSAKWKYVDADDIYLVICKRVRK
jgi:hypothetical protein